MKKIRSICGKTLLLFLCTVLLLLAGCGAREESEEDPFNYDTEMTDENSMEITLVNASGYPVREFLTWWDGDQDGFDLLHNSGRNLKPDESITVRSVPAMIGRIHRLNRRNTRRDSKHS